MAGLAWRARFQWFQSWSPRWTACESLGTPGGAVAAASAAARFPSLRGTRGRGARVRPAPGEVFFAGWITSFSAISILSRIKAYKLASHFYFLVSSGFVPRYILGLSKEYFQVFYSNDAWFP